MRRTTTCCTRQLLSSVPFRPTKEIPRVSSQCLRPFSNTARTAADDITSIQLAQRQKDDVAGIFNDLSKLKAKSARNSLKAYNPAKAGDLVYKQDAPPSVLMPGGSLTQSKEPYHFHIYAARHNTHITVTDPNRAPLISVACGNIGFRHSARKNYDSAFQLAGYVVGQMLEKGITLQIAKFKLEVVLRGFGAGREAVTKALLGAEGRVLRSHIVKVSDSTRLKFGGTRSKKPRRLG